MVAKPIESVDSTLAVGAAHHWARVATPKETANMFREYFSILCMASHFFIPHRKSFGYIPDRKRSFVVYGENVRYCMALNSKYMFHYSR